MHYLERLISLIRWPWWVNCFHFGLSGNDIQWLGSQASISPSTFAQYLQSNMPICVVRVDCVNKSVFVCWHIFINRQPRVKLCAFWQNIILYNERFIVITIVHYLLYFSSFIPLISATPVVLQKSGSYQIISLNHWLFVLLLWKSSRSRYRQESMPIKPLSLLKGCKHLKIVHMAILKNSFHPILKNIAAISCN